MEKCAAAAVCVCEKLPVLFSLSRGDARTELPVCVYEKFAFKLNVAEASPWHFFTNFFFSRAKNEKKRKKKFWKVARERDEGTRERQMEYKLGTFTALMSGEPGNDIPCYFTVSLSCLPHCSSTTLSSAEYSTSPTALFLSFLRIYAQLLI